MNSWSPEELAAFQQADVNVRLVAEWKAQQVSRPQGTVLNGHNTVVRGLCSVWDSLELRDGVLYRAWAPKHDKTQLQLQYVVPQALQEIIFAQLHSARTGGHMGIERTVGKVRSRFFWPGCKGDLKRWCEECMECARAKSGPRHKNPLQQCPTGAPLDRVAIDICGEFPETTRGNKYVLVLCDYFTK